MTDGLLLVGAILIALVGVYSLWRQGTWPKGWPVTGEPVILGALGLMVYLAFQIAGGFAVNKIGGDPAKLHLVHGALRFVCVAILFVIVKFLVHPRDPMNQLKPPSWSAVGYVLLPYLLILPLMFLISPKTEQQAVLDLQALTGFLPKAYLFFGIVLAAPLWEELLFRGFLQGAMRRSYPASLSVLVTAAFFAFVHEESVRIPVFFLGLLLGAVYEKNRGFWAPWLIHALNNLITYVYVVNGGGHA